MKNAKILTILVLAIVIVSWAKVNEAAPLGNAFTYQGHLYDANHVANNLYDFQFKLYDANSEGIKKGNDVNIPDVDVIDGYFAVNLDFGSNVFDGNERWLEIGVRPGELVDPNEYTVLEPRQKLAPTPYALQTRGIFVSSGGNVGIGTTSPSTKLYVSGVIAATDGNSNKWNTAYTHKTNEDVINGLVKCNGGGGYSAVTDSSSDWNTAYAHKTTEDAISGLVKCNGGGGYSAVTDNSSNWNTAYTHKTTEDAISGLVKCNGGGGYSAIPDNDANWNTAYSWGDHASAGYLKTETDPQVSSATTNKVPKWDDTNKTLVDGTIYDNGNVGIGTTTPARILHINDVMRLQPRTTVPPSPAEGDIYMNGTTHVLMLYNGTTWVPL